MVLLPPSPVPAAGKTVVLLTCAAHLVFLGGGARTLTALCVTCAYACTVPVFFGAPVIANTCACSLLVGSPGSLARHGFELPHFASDRIFYGQMRLTPGTDPS